MDHQGLVLGLELYFECPKPVQKILQRLTLLLLHAKKIERDWWWGLVNNELFSEQLREMVERGDVAIRKATKPLQSCACERTYEHLAMYGVCSSRNNHMGIERRKVTLGVFYARKNNLGCYVVSWYESIHDSLREWLEASSKASLHCRAFIRL